MQKLHSLRAALTRTVPTFQRNPDALEVWVESGTLVATSAKTASFEYRYVLNILAKDFSENPDWLMLCIISWVKVNQPDLLENYAEKTDGMSFEVDQLNHKTADILIKLKLTEAVIVTLDDSNPPRITITNPKPSETTERWELWIRDEKIMEWNAKPDGWPRP